MVRIKRNQLKPLFSETQELYKNVGLSRKFNMILKTYNIRDKFKQVEIYIRMNNEDELVAKYEFLGNLNDLKTNFKQRMSRIIKEEFDMQ